MYLFYILSFQVDPNSNALVIFNGRESDSGRYTCQAENGYKRDSDSVDITVANIVMPHDCNDNPYFANCKLIVKAEYCANVYYRKFCCRSCTDAGQIKHN